MAELVKKHTAINEKKQSMPGYRIQVYSGQERNKATEINNSITIELGDISSYLIYQQPNFKVRVGDFKTRLEAFRVLIQIKSVYTTAFIVRDEVKLIH